MERRPTALPPASDLDQPPISAKWPRIRGFEPFRPAARLICGKAAIGWRAGRSSVTGNKSRPRTLAFRIIREASHAHA
jgi:hypothetical protein